MSRTAAKFTELDVRRALKAAKSVDPELTVQVELDGSLLIIKSDKQTRPQDHLTKYDAVRDKGFIKDRNARFLAKQREVGTCVYFIEVMGRVKIGFAKDLADRIERFQTGCPTYLTIVGIIPGGKDKEAEIHELFYEHRTTGEWFMPHPKLVRFIMDNSINAD
jgi:hypothetical protein